MLLKRGAGQVGQAHPHSYVELDRRLQGLGRKGYHDAGAGGHGEIETWRGPWLGSDGRVGSNVLRIVFL